MNGVLKNLRRSFVAGLVIVLPGAGSVAILIWLFTKFTDVLLPKKLHDASYELLYRLAALVLFFALVTTVGWITRLVAGKKLIHGVERLIARIPLLSTIYIFIKEVSDTLIGSKKTVFERVVMVEYPRQGLYTIGFVTNEAGGEAQARTTEQVINVFLPTTPNPTSGWLVLVPKDEVINLDMTVAEGMKLVISGGSVIPAWPAKSVAQPTEPAPTA